MQNAIDMGLLICQNHRTFAGKNITDNYAVRNESINHKVSET